MTNKCDTNIKFALGWVENIVGKGENAGYQDFLPFPLCFPKASILGPLKSNFSVNRFLDLTNLI